MFRPIALCNMPMKVVTNIIAKRLKLLMSNLVGEMLSSFVPGRKAADNIFITQEVFHSMQHLKDKQGFMAIKIDFEKAYN